MTIKDGDKVVTELSAAGRSAVEIAAVMRCHPDTVRKARRRLGIYVGPVVTDEVRRGRLADVSELTQRGYSLTQISNKLDISPRTVLRYRRKAGFGNPCPPRPFSPEEVARVEELLEDGCSFSECARTVGRDVKTLGVRFRGKSKWDAHSAGAWRGWQKQFIKRHGERGAELLKELAAEDE